jgi:hypothetical protein
VWEERPTLGLKNNAEEVLTGAFLTEDGPEQNPPAVLFVLCKVVRWFVMQTQLDDKLRDNGHQRNDIRPAIIKT